MNKTEIVPVQYTKNQEDIEKTLDFIKNNGIVPIHTLILDTLKLRENEGIHFYKVKRQKSVDLLVHLDYTFLEDREDYNGRLATFIPNTKEDVVVFLDEATHKEGVWIEAAFNVMGHADFKSLKESDLSINGTNRLVKLGFEFELLKTVIFADGSEYTRSLGVFKKYQDANNYKKLEQKADLTAEIEAGQINIAYSIILNPENFLKTFNQK